LNQDGCAALLKLAQDPVALLLLLVSVDAHGGVALSPHQPGQVIRLPLRFDKDEDFVVRLATDFFKKSCQLLLLLVLLTDIDNLALTFKHVFSFVTDIGQK